MHGGVALDALTHPDPEALKLGLENLAAHLDSAQQFERPVIVAINQFANDSAEELALIHEFCQSRAVPCATANVFGEGGAGATQLAETVLAALPKTAADPLPFLYQPHESVEQKLHAIATRIYGADGVTLTDEAKAKIALFEKSGFGHLPLCMAKTQNSLSDQLTALGRPPGFRITVRDFEIANGAGFIVALCGTLVRMPALPKVPAAERIRVDASGKISGI